MQTLAIRGISAARQPRPEPQAETPEEARSTVTKTAKTAIQNKMSSNFRKASDAFQHFDFDRSGKLDEGELRQAAQLAGVELNEQEVHKLMGELTSDGEGVDAATFMKFLTGRSSETDGLLKNQIKRTKTALSHNWNMNKILQVVRAKLEGSSSGGSAAAKKAFMRFDQTGNGSIDKKEIGSFLKTWGVDLTEHQVDELMEAVDSNNDGQLDYNEFVNGVMKNSATTTAIGKNSAEDADKALKTMFSNKFTQLRDAFRHYDTDKVLFNFEYV